MNPLLAAAGEGLGFLLPPAVNPNTAAGPVLATIGRTATAAISETAGLAPITRADPTSVIDTSTSPTTVSVNRGNQIHPGESIQSPGIVTVESHGAGLDGAARRTSGESQRVVIQAVDQEGGVTANWKTQGDWQALVATHQVANLISRPVNPRKSGSTRLAEALENPMGALGEFNKEGQLIAGPLPPFADNQEWEPDWRLDFGAINPVRAVDADKPRGNDNRLDTAASQVDLIEDGAVLKPNVVAGYMITSASTAVSKPAPLAPRAATGIDATGLGSVWISMQVRFPTVPSDRAVLLSARAPLSASASVEIAPDSIAQTGFQNRWQFIFDPNTFGSGRPGLRLIVANAAIPHTAAGAKGCPSGARMVWDMKDTPAIDERSLGNQGRGTLTDALFAPSNPTDIADPADPFRGPVELRVALNPEVNRWYHLLVVQTHSQLGGTAILIDGLIGRSWIQDPTTIDMTKTGDWYVYPSLGLAQDFLKVDPSIDSGMVLMSSGSSFKLKVKAPPGLTVDKILPESGLVRIDDEYVAYRSMVGGDSQEAELTDWIRARRVNTNHGDPNNKLNWPLTQDHRASSSVVVPGWFRYDATSARGFHTGSATLKQTLGSGHIFDRYPAPPAGWGSTLAAVAYRSDESIGANSTTIKNFRYRTWGWVGATGTTTPLGRYIDLTQSLSIITPSLDWPKTGQLRLLQVDYTGALSPLTSDPAYLFTTNTNGTPLQLVNAPATAAFVPKGSALLALVTSIATSWDDPIRFHDPANGSIRKAIQLLDQQSNRCEWIRYDEIVSATTASGDPVLLFTNPDGFPYLPGRPLNSYRGSMRTAFSGDAKLLSNGVVFSDFPVGSSVLPVQDEQGPAVYGLEPGDVVTLAANGTLDIDSPPIQRAVRFAASDGYSLSSATSPATDTMNQWFAFTTSVPATAPAAPAGFSVLVGQGWNSRCSMSPGSGIWTNARTSLMPRIEALGTDLAHSGDPLGPRVTLGPDWERGDPRSSQDTVFDAIAAGDLGDIDGQFRDGLGILTVYGVKDRPIPSIGGLPIEVEAVPDAPIFGRYRGLVLIDGEVFAYRQKARGDMLKAVLIARGLLGTRQREHSIPASNSFAGKTRFGILPAIPIPIGPIAVLGEVYDTREDANYGHSTLPVTATAGYSIRAGLNGHQFFQYGFQAPAYVMASTDGTKVEAMVLFQDLVSRIKIPSGNNPQILDLPPKALTAPWLRGMWGTKPLNWTGDEGGGNGDGKDPVIIPWWPRHASALPTEAEAPSNPVDLAAQLRSRRYQWAGPAIRRYGMRVDKGPVSHDITASPDGPRNSRVEIRGFAPLVGCTPKDLFDWTNPNAVKVLMPTSSTPWGTQIKEGEEVDGAEYRIHLRYTGAGTSTWDAIPEAAAERLEVTEVSVRVAAPIRVLAVEGER